MSNLPLRLRTCISFKEWWNTGGMGSNCNLPADHEGDHTDGTKYGVWHRTREEKLLLEEIKRLREMIINAE